MNPEMLDDNLLNHWAIPLNEPVTETTAPDVIPFPTQPEIPENSSVDDGFLLRGIEPTDEGFHPRLRRFDEAA